MTEAEIFILMLVWWLFENWFTLCKFTESFLPFTTEKKMISLGSGLELLARNSLFLHFILPQGQWAYLEKVGATQTTQTSHKSVKENGPEAQGWIIKNTASFMLWVPHMEEYLSLPQAARGLSVEWRRQPHSTPC